MAHDILDLDDRIVDENACRQRDRQQADEVEREAERLHHEEGGHDGQRQRDGGDDRRAEIAQEQEDNEDRQARALEQRVHRRVVIALRIAHRRVDQLESDLRMRRGGLLHEFLDLVGDGDIARALRTQDAESDDRLTVEPGEGAGRLGRVGDMREGVEPQAAAMRKMDRHRRKRGQGLRGAGIRLRGLDLRVGLRGGQAMHRQRDGIERDGDFPRHAADALDTANAGQRLQTTDDIVIHERRQLLGVQLRRFGSISDNIETDGIDALDNRRVDAARQVRGDLRDSGFDRTGRLVRIDAQIEADGCRRDAIADRRRDMMHPGDAGDCRLDLAGDLHPQARSASHRNR